MMRPSLATARGSRDHLPPAHRLQHVLPTAILGERRVRPHGSARPPSRPRRGFNLQRMLATYVYTCANIRRPDDADGGPRPDHEMDTGALVDLLLRVMQSTPLPTASNDAASDTGAAPRAAPSFDYDSYAAAGLSEGKVEAGPNPGCGCPEPQPGPAACKEAPLFGGDAAAERARRGRELTRSMAEIERGTETDLQKHCPIRRERIEQARRESNDMKKIDGFDGQRMLFELRDRGLLRHGESRTLPELYAALRADIRASWGAKRAGECTGPPSRPFAAGMLLRTHARLALHAPPMGYHALRCMRRQWAATPRVRFGSSVGTCSVFTVAV